MKNKNLMMALGVVAVGAAAYFLFFRKKDSGKGTEMPLATDMNGSTTVQSGEPKTPEQPKSKGLLDLIKLGTTKGTSQAGDVKAGTVLQIKDLTKSGGVI